MAVGNTFGATALSSYGGFWISYAIIQTPGGFDIAAAYTSESELHNALGFYLIGWFIFTFILLLCTLRSTVAFFMLFFTLDLAFMFLAIAEFQQGVGKSYNDINRAGGYFGLLAAFLAWYNALAGIADSRSVHNLISHACSIAFGRPQEARLFFGKYACLGSCYTSLAMRCTHHARRARAVG